MVLRYLDCGVPVGINLGISSDDGRESLLLHERDELRREISLVPEAVPGSESHKLVAENPVPSCQVSPTGSAAERGLRQPPDPGIDVVNAFVGFAETSFTSRSGLISAKVFTR